MRTSLPDRVEAGRIRDGVYGSRHGVLYGAFKLMGPCGAELAIIMASPDDPVNRGWEHVSVSTNRRPPNWHEMSFVKDLFWEPEECVVQFHVPRQQHINVMPYCLHLWRSTKDAFPLPPPELV